MKTADSDTLKTLADLELDCELSGGEDVNEQNRRYRIVTVFRRMVREAGYEIPDDFDYHAHLG